MRGLVWSTVWGAGRREPWPWGWMTSRELVSCICLLGCKGTETVV